MHLYIGVGSLSGIQKSLISHKLYYFNRLAEYLCRRRNCSVLSTCATRAGRGVGTMWLTGLFFNLYTDIVRTETAGPPVELFIQPVSHSIDK